MRTEYNFLEDLFYKDQDFKKFKEELEKNEDLIIKKIFEEDLIKKESLEKEIRKLKSEIKELKNELNLEQKKEKLCN